MKSNLLIGALLAIAILVSGCSVTLTTLTITDIKMAKLVEKKITNFLY